MLVDRQLFRSHDDLELNLEQKGWTLMILGSAVAAAVAQLGKRPELRSLKREVQPKLIE